MPPTRIRIPVQSNNRITKDLDALWYGVDSSLPATVKIATVIPGLETPNAPRFPCFEGLLGCDRKIHDCWVSCYDQTGRPHRFLIGFQFRPGSINRALQATHDICLRADLIVMRGGCRTLVVNMGRKKYRDLAKLAVRRFLVLLAQKMVNALSDGKTRYSIPKEIR